MLAAYTAETGVVISRLLRVLCLSMLSLVVPDPLGQVFLLDLAAEWELVGGWRDIYEAVHGEPAPDPELLLGKVVTHVNGVPAARHMQQLADARGGMLRSPGARLNLLLMEDDPLGCILDEVRPPSTDSEVFTFEDGTLVEWKLTVAYNGNSEVGRHIAAAQPPSFGSGSCCF